MNSSTSRLALGVASLLGVCALATAQIERLTLTQMVSKTDDCVLGTITDKRVSTVPAPWGEGTLYFTELTIQGRSLETGQASTVVVAYPGGDLVGIHNSEAPSADDSKVGRSVVAFYKWSDNMGGSYAANALYASHGGLYPTFQRRGKTIVQGRGEGYAVASNVELGQLDAQVSALAESKRK